MIATVPSRAPPSNTFTRTQWNAILGSPSQIQALTRGAFFLVVTDVGGAFDSLFYKAQNGSTADTLRQMAAGSRPAAPVFLPLATFVTASGPALEAVGWANYDPALYDLSGFSVKLRVRFRASMSLAGAVAEVTLVDLTTGATVATLTPNVSTRNPPPSYASGVFNASATATCYELRARITNDGGDPNSYVELGGASLEIVSWVTP